MSQWNYGEGKTYSSSSEAFRDANYATPIWKCETDWDRSKDYAVWGIMWVGVFGALYGFMKFFN